MARYGQTLLRQLTLQYCDRMGCSVGMRWVIQPFQSSTPTNTLTHAYNTARPLPASSFVSPPREYIESALPGFRQRHPDVQVVTLLRRNRFPLVKAEYGKPAEQV